MSRFSINTQSKKSLAAQTYNYVPRGFDNPILEYVPLSLFKNGGEETRLEDSARSLSVAA